MRRQPLPGAVSSWLALPRGALDGAHDPRVSPATADVGAHVVPDLRARRARIRREQRGGAHQLARLAVAALRHALGEPGALQRVQAPWRQPFDRGDRLALHARHRRQAGKRAPALDVHHADAALPGAAAVLGSGELELFAQHPQQGRSVRGGARDGPAIDGESNGHEDLPGLTLTCYIGGTWPCSPTLTRGAASVPSGWRCALTKTGAPGLSSLRLDGV